MNAPLSAAPADIDGASLPDALPKPLPLSMKTIIKICGQLLDVGYVDLVSHRKTTGLVRARSIIMYVIRLCTVRSYPEIGMAFGGRDHSSVIAAVNKIDGMLSVDPALGERINALITVLRRSAAETDTSDPDPYRVAHRVMRQPQSAVNVSVECIRAFAAIVTAAEAEALAQSSEVSPEIQRLKTRNERLEIRLAQANSLVVMEAQMRRFLKAGMSLRIARANGTFEADFINFERQTEALLQAAHRHYSSRKETK